MVSGHFALRATDSANDYLQLHIIPVRSHQPMMPPPATPVSVLDHTAKRPVSLSDLF
jgi:hypothetical protein